MPLNAALVLDIAPRKVGSFEELVLAVCNEAAQRGHALDVFTWDPIHPQVASGLTATGARHRRLAELMAGGSLAASRALCRYRVIQLHHCGARGRIAISAYAALPARVQFVDRSSGVPADDERRPLARQLAGAIVDAVISARLSRLAAVSEWVRERDRLRFGREDVKRVLNGVNLDRFRPRRPGNGTRPSVLCVCHLIPEKGVDVFIQALAQLPGVEATIVGDGPDLPRLHALASQHGVLERIRFTGLTSDVPERMAAADLFVHPAVWHEAFGFAIAEAMAAGLPVVATLVGGIPEIVAEGRTGFLVPPGHPDAMAAAMRRLLDDPELRASMGEAGRARAVELFDVRRCAASYVDLLESAG